MTPRRRFSHPSYFGDITRSRIGWESDFPLPILSLSPRAVLFRPQLLFHNSPLKLTVFRQTDFFTYFSPPRHEAKSIIFILPVFFFDLFGPPPTVPFFKKLGRRPVASERFLSNTTWPLFRPPLPFFLVGSPISFIIGTERFVPRPIAPSSCLGHLPYFSLIFFRLRR